MSGENTEVDKTVIEQLADPLTHMIRNAVDHGIETPAERSAHGKPSQGNIHLRPITNQAASSSRSATTAQVSTAHASWKSKREGLVPADAMLTEEEIDQVIFLPGFSTAAQVTSLSGRGVGMDSQ